MKLWKTTVAVSLAALSIATLVACSSTSSKSEQESKTLTIGYWKGNDTENATLNKLIETFEKDNNVKVESKVYTDITTQLPTDLSGGTAPDVFYVDSSFYPYLQREGVLNDLTDVVKQTDFYPTLSKAFSTDGKIYAAPKDVSTLAIYVNKSIFSKAGLQVSDIPSSYEELLKWASGAQEKLDATYGKGNVYLLNVNADLPRNWTFVTAGDQNPISNEGIVNFSNPKIVENLKFIVDLYNTGAIMSPQQIGAGDEGAAFATGKFALTLTGNWNYQVFKTQYKDLDFDIIPNLTFKGKRSTMQFTVGWGEYSKTKSKDLADKWIKYVSGKEGMTTWTEGVGTLATRKDVADSTTALKNNPLLKIHQDQIDNAIAWQDGVHLSTVVSSYGNFVPDAFKAGTDKEKLEKVLKEIDDDANSKINK